MKQYAPKILATLFLFTAGAFTVYAQGYVPLAPLPGTVSEGVGGVPTTNLAQYISGTIKLLIALGAALAFLFAIIGGTQYVAASINPVAKQNALERIWNSLIGLAIILSAYLVLNSINPKLVSFNLTLEQVTPGTLEKNVVSTAPTDTSCPISPLTPLTGMAQEMENGSNVVWEAGAEAGDLTTTINANLAKTKAEADKLIAALPSVGASGTVTSAYRPYDYQKHLYEVNNKWNGLNGESLRLRDLNTEAWPGCVPLQQVVGVEHSKHFGDKGAAQVVANPLGSAPHTFGTGVDIKLSKIDYTAIDAFMTSKGIKLDWQNLPDDEVHFNYSASGPK